MKAILIPFLSLLIPLTPKSAFAQSEPELKLESVVIVSRHGVRAPTKATQLMQDVTPDAWPTWPVKLGWLTPRGGELIAYLGHYQRQRLVADGLLTKNGCPQPGQVAIIADVDERTRKTGEAFAAGLAQQMRHHIEQMRRTKHLGGGGQSGFAGTVQGQNQALIAAVQAADQAAAHRAEQLADGVEQVFSHTGSLTRHDGQPGWALQLTPREPALARMIQRIELKGSSHAEEILLKTEAGDTTRIEFLRMTAAQALTPAEVAEFE